MESPQVPIPHSWQEIIWLFLAAFLGYGGTYLPSLFRRRQSKAESEKTKAETRSIDLNTTLHAGDMLLKWMEKFAKASNDIDQLRKRAEFWQARAEALQAEKDLLETQLDGKIRIGKPKD